MVVTAFLDRCRRCCRLTDGDDPVGALCDGVRKIAAYRGRLSSQKPAGRFTAVPIVNQ